MPFKQKIEKSIVRGMSLKSEQKKDLLQEMRIKRAKSLYQMMTKLEPSPEGGTIDMSNSAVPMVHIQDMSVLDHLPLKRSKNKWAALVKQMQVSQVVEMVPRKNESVADFHS